MADHAATTGLSLSDKSYNTLRRVVEKVFPGISALYAALAVIWGWGYVGEVSGTFAALAVFGGILLSLSRKNYNADGTLVPTDPESPETTGYKFELNENVDPAELLNKKQIVFKGLDTL